MEMVGWLFLHCLRAVERFLPPGCLWVLFWPVAAIRAGWEITRGEARTGGFSRLPASLRLVPPGSTWRGQLWRQRTQLHLTKLLVFWPDRLLEERWQRYCRCTGLEQWERIRTGSQPIILAGLHFGPGILLHYWLRAQGLAAAELAEAPWSSRPLYRRCLGRLSDAASGLTGVPHLFDLGQLRQVHEFLRPQRVLVVHVDGSRGKEQRVRGEDFDFGLATGAIRLAARVKAAVVPCLCTADTPLGITIHFGDPVPGEWIADERQQAAACSHLLRAFLPVVRATPGQCEKQLLWRFRVLDGEPEAVGAGRGKLS
jgi:lauroyl/myristoyl acyltransferase